MRRQVRAAIARLQRAPGASASGHRRSPLGPRIALIEGEALLSAEPPWMVDGLHPSAMGQQLLAQKLDAAFTADAVLARVLEASTSGM